MQSECVEERKLLQRGVQKEFAQERRVHKREGCIREKDIGILIGGILIEAWSPTAKWRGLASFGAPAKGLPATPTFGKPSSIG